MSNEDRKACGTFNKNFSYIFIPVICIQGADNLTLESFLTVDAKIIAEAATFPASTAIIERWL